MKRIVPLVLLAAVVAAGYWYTRGGSDDLVLTGIVTTQDVIVSPQIAGRLDELLVDEGDPVTRGQLLAVLDPGELQAQSAYYASAVGGVTAQVQESEAALRLQEQQSTEQIRQAEATLAAAEAQRMEAMSDIERLRADYERYQTLAAQNIATAQQLEQARSAYEAATARVEALGKQVEAQQAAVALARAGAEQVAVRRSQVEASRRQLEAADAQREQADVRLAYSRIVAPVDGVVDVRAARVGEVVGAAQPILTLIDPDDLWIRADVEETYVDRVHVGDRFTVRLPSGDEREGTVFRRAVDAGFATQRDVSRTKRDIKTFELRLRVDNADRALAVGMTAYVLIPTGTLEP